MALLPGTRLGPYEILAAVGAGGMGEVYRGRDTRLDRTVAIKVLPDDVAGDPERLARFEREAKTLAALNHTNIAQIYGLEQGALAMEFVEGEDLSQRISRGALPTDDALAIAGQIADALEAAHEFGIVHRDLKPSNIRVRDDGTVKVLDFGLAKALAPASASVGATSAPTITSPAMTALGTILGTAAYMAPEQAKGRAVDKRGDIWAFGVVLYEMIAGRRLFDGDSVSDVLAAVIKSEPDWSPIPRHLQRLLKSCLEKDPKRRLRDIGDWRREIDETPAAVRPASTTREVVAWATAATFLVATAALAFAYFRQAPPRTEPVRFQIPAPANNVFDGVLGVAPDGRSVAFLARDDKGVTRLWVREFAALEARPLVGTEGARSLAWKPDGTFIAFGVDRTLKKIPVGGGPVVTLCEVQNASAFGGTAWNAHGDILIGGVTGGSVRRVAESGGAVTPVTTLDPKRQEVVHGIQSFLPDGKHFVYLSISAVFEQSAIFVGSVDRTPENQDRQPLITMGSQAQYAPVGAQGGRLLFVKQGTLLSQPFDADRLTLSGEPTPIAERVGNTGALAFFSATAAALVYRTGGVSGAGREARLTWLDRQGTPGEAVGSPAYYASVDLALDGTRAGVTITPNPNADVWVVDLARGVSARLTTSPTADRGTVWSPDGTRIAFYSNRGGRFDLYVTSANGEATEELLLKSDAMKIPTNWSRDGRFLLYETTRPQAGFDLWVLPLQGDRTPVPIVQTEFAELDARFSPDGHWMLYSSNVSGRNEIYVRSFDPASPGASAGVTQVSKDGGMNAKWRKDGKELFFEAPDGKLMAADVLTGPQFRPGVPHALFPLPQAGLWDPAPDGHKFLVAMPTSDQGRAPITVVLNWGSAPGK